MKINKVKPTKGFRDTFNLYMIKDKKLVGDLEMPYIDLYKGPKPTKVLNYVTSSSHPEECFCHFYLYDYLFDGRNGLWYGTQENSDRVESFIKRLRNYQGVITPDYSVYVDMPLVMQYWNIYRGRAIYVWLTSLGINTIYNIRWGDYRTYDVVFYGVAKHSTLAVGSHGLIKNTIQRHTFMTGFVEMIKRLEPSCLIVYGSYTKEMEELCKEHNIEVIHFDSEQTEARQ